MGERRGHDERVAAQDVKTICDILLGWREVTVLDVLSLAEKLQDASFVLRPGRYFIQTSAVSEPAFNWEAGRELEFERNMDLTSDFKPGVGWELVKHQENWRRGERLVAPFSGFVRQEASKP